MVSLLALLELAKWLELQKEAKKERDLCVNATSDGKFASVKKRRKSGNVTLPPVGKGKTRSSKTGSPSLQSDSDSEAVLISGRSKGGRR